MSEGRLLGFRFTKPPEWNGWWILMWFAFTPVWLAFAFILSISVANWLIWLAIFTGLFLVPEMVSIAKRKVELPPLTHTIRHYLPNDAAFPLIYGSLGAIAARWLGIELPRYLGVAAAVATLGWLTTHFTVTYARPDPFPGVADVASKELPPVRDPSPL